MPPFSIFLQLHLASLSLCTFWCIFHSNSQDLWLHLWLPTGNLILCIPSPPPPLFSLILCNIIWILCTVISCQLFFFYISILYVFLFLLFSFTAQCVWFMWCMVSCGWSCWLWTGGICSGYSSGSELSSCWECWRKLSTSESMNPSTGQEHQVNKSYICNIIISQTLLKLLWKKNLDCMKLGSFSMYL